MFSNYVEKNNDNIHHGFLVTFWVAKPVFFSDFFGGKTVFLSDFFSGKTVFFSDFFSGKTCFFSYFFIGCNPSNLYMFGIKSKWKGFTLIYIYI